MNRRAKLCATSTYSRPVRVGGLAALVLGLVTVTAGSAGAAGPTAVDLRTAGGFAVLGGTTITNSGPTVINGDLGLSPGTAVTGFPPGTVNGTIHTTDAVAAQAQTDLVTAFNDAAGRTSNSTVSANLGGQTLSPGVYKGAPSLALTGTLTLDGGGDPNAVFIFQMPSSTLTTSSGSGVNLIRGAQACNVVWQVGSSATLGTNSHLVGNVLALTAVTMTTGATIDGSALARNAAVTLDSNTVSRALCAAAAAGTSTTTTTASGGSTTTTPGGGTATTTPGGGTTGTTGGAPGRPGSGTATGLTNSPPLAGTGLGTNGTLLGLTLTALGLLLTAVTRRRPAGVVVRT
jgi:hypothetical protein